MSAFTILQADVAGCLLEHSLLMMGLLEDDTASMEGRGGKGGQMENRQ